MWCGGRPNDRRLHHRGTRQNQTIARFLADGPRTEAELLEPLVEIKKKPARPMPHVHRQVHILVAAAGHGRLNCKTEIEIHVETTCDVDETYKKSSAIRRYSKCDHDEEAILDRTTHQQQKKHRSPVGTRLRWPSPRTKTAAAREHTTHEEEFVAQASSAHHKTSEHVKSELKSSRSSLPGPINVPGSEKRRPNTSRGSAARGQCREKKNNATIDMFSSFTQNMVARRLQRQKKRSPIPRDDALAT